MCATQDILRLEWSLLYVSVLTTAHRMTMVVGHSVVQLLGVTSSCRPWPRLFFNFIYSFRRVHTRLEVPFYSLVYLTVHTHSLPLVSVSLCVIETDRLRDSVTLSCVCVCVCVCVCARERERERESFTLIFSIFNT